MFFEDRVAFPPPTHRDFKAKDWENFRGTPDEINVAKLALHVNSVHSRVRAESAETYKLFPQNREMRVAVILSLFNHFCAELLLASQGKELEDGSSVGEIISSKIRGVPTSTEITPDEALCTFVDSIRFPLFDLLRADDERFQDQDGDLLAAARFHGHAGQIYQVWYDMWQDVELRTLRPHEDNILRYEKPELAWAAVLAAHRSQRNSLTAVLAAQQVWTDLDRGIKKRYAKPVLKIGDGTVRFRQGQDIPEDAPLQFILSNDLTLEVSRAALATSLPKLGGVVIREIVRCWEILSLVATELCEGIQNEIVNAGPEGAVKPSSCVFQFNRLDLIKDLSRCTEISMGKVARIVDVMTYSGEKMAPLWGRPLISAGKDKLQILLAPLVVGKLTYPLKDWVRSGGGDLSEKGVSFEKELYDDVSRYLSGSTFLRQWRVFPSVDIAAASRKEEVDMIIASPSNIYIVEAKNFLPSYESHEVPRYLKAVDDASKQAARKASGFLSDMAGLRAFCEKKKIRFSVDTDKVGVFPLVVMYGPLGVGIESWACPVVDRTTLLKFLGNERPSVFEAGRDGSRKLADGGVIYSSGSEADSGFYDYMSRPPIIERYKSLIRERIIPLFSDIDVRSDYELSYFELAPDPEEVDAMKRWRETEKLEKGGKSGPVHFPSPLQNGVGKKGGG